MDKEPTCSNAVGPGPERPAGSAPPPAPAQDSADLKAYIHLKQGVARQVRALHRFLLQQGDEALAEQCHDLTVKLAEDRFTLAVVGQFKRGKSSLMNAIIGREVLPTGVLPLTSAITILRYGPRERLVIPRKGTMFQEEAPLSGLPDYVTEKGNPGNRKNVDAVYVELPLPFLRRGLEFVDTPGVGSAIEANTATTYEFLPRCDAVLFVTSVDSPLTALEIEFLRNIRQHVGKVFFIINKTDLLGAQERDEVLGFVTATLRREVEAEDLKVYPVSSRLALLAQQTGGAREAAAHGLGALHDALARFLAVEKSAVFLAAVLVKAGRLLKQEERRIDLLRLGRAASADQRRDSLRRAEEEVGLLGQHRDNLLVDLRPQLRQLAGEVIAGRFGEFCAAEVPALRREIHQAPGVPWWKPAQSAVTAMAGHCLDRLRRDLGDWMARQNAAVGAELRSLVDAARPPLIETVTAIPEAIARGLGVEAAEYRGIADGTDLDIRLSLKPAGVGEIVWSPVVPRVTARLPVCMAGRRWREHLAADLPAAMAAAQGAALLGVGISVDQALDQVAQQLHERAAGLAANLLAGLSGDGDPPRGRTKTPARDNPAQTTQELDALGASFAALAQGVQRLNSGQATATEPAPAPEAPPPPAAPVPIQESDLLAALRARGCPACNHAIDALANFYAKWQYTLANSEDAQRSFAAHRGLCPLHTWQLAAISSPLGLSQTYPRLVDQVSAQLTRLGEGPAHAGAVAALMPTPAECPACRLLHADEDAYLRRLAAFLDGAAARSAYARGQGLCLRHLDLLLPMPGGTELPGFLVREAARHFEELAEDMRSYALKHEAIRRTLHNQDEEDAYTRALIHLVGERSLCLPWSEDVEL